MGRALSILCRQDGRTAVLSENRLLEYYQTDETAGTLVGSVFLGRVERVLPDIKAAFVKIGQPKNGFLPLRESDSFHQTHGNVSLMSAQEILVQVKKDPKGEKGAFLTRDIVLPGQYILVMPQNRFVGVSKRVEDAQDHARAKRLGRQIAGERFGVIVRHAALFARPQAVRDEAEELWQTWQGIQQKAACTKAPCVMYRDVSPVEMLQRDYGARCEITLQREADMGSVAMDAAWNAAHVQRQLREALSRYVPLPGGGSLIVDEREALSTIDVNSGSTVFASDGDGLPLEENLRAVPEIARQIRLRNLSGIVLVDFIDMDLDGQRAQVQAAMEAALSEDRVKTVVHGFTSLGLLELTRKRTRDSLRDLLTQPCGACRETGRVIRG